MMMAPKMNNLLLGTPDGYGLDRAKKSQKPKACQKQCELNLRCIKIEYGYVLACFHCVDWNPNDF